MRVAAAWHGKEEPAKRLVLHSAAPFSEAHVKPQLFWVRRKAPEEWGDPTLLIAAEALPGRVLEVGRAWGSHLAEGLLGTFLRIQRLLPAAFSNPNPLTTAHSPSSPTFQLLLLH